MHDQQPNTHRNQRPRGQSGKKWQREPRQCIGAQHVIAGEQGRVDEADREQHDHTGVMRPPRLFTAALD